MPAASNDVTVPATPTLKIVGTPLIAASTEELVSCDLTLQSVLDEHVEDMVENCMLCLSLGQDTSTESELCVDTQKLHCCHRCQQRGCWSTNRYCGKSFPEPQLTASCGFCLIKGRVTWPNSSLCLHWQACEQWHCVETLKDARRHVCLESASLGCVACSKMCPKDKSSELCEFFGKERGKVTWTPTTQESQDTRMFQQDLKGALRHMTQLSCNGGA